jgi:hypothetical protein
MKTSAILGVEATPPIAARDLAPTCMQASDVPVPVHRHPDKTSILF